MTEIMTPSQFSPMTDEQADKLVAQFRAAVQKKRRDFGTEAAQAALGTDNLGMRLLEPFRLLVEANSDLIVRRVSVNRTRDGMAAIDATARVKYVDGKVVKAMPKGEGEEVDVTFFKPKPWEYTRPGYMSDADLEKALARRTLKASDPYSVDAVNEDDPAFADDHPHGTHWQDENGNWCFAAFDRWRDDRRYVFVDRHDHDWDGLWWFAGLAQVSA